MRSEVAVYATLLMLLALALTMSSDVLAGHASRTEVMWFAGCLTAVLVSLPILAVKDSFVFVNFVALAAVFFLLAMTLVIAVTEAPTTTQYVEAGLAGGTLVGAMGYQFATQRRRDPIPNVLREQFARPSISELRGVQFSARAWPTGDMLEVFIQNCVDAPRTVELRFENAGFVFQRTPPVALGAVEPTMLRPGEVTLVQIPMASPSHGYSHVDLALIPRVSGPSGERIRSWRARGLSAPTPLWLIVLMVILALPLGIHLIVWGRGGFKLSLRAAPGYGRPPLPARATTLWAPP